MFCKRTASNSCPDNRALRRGSLRTLVGLLAVTLCTLGTVPEAALAGSGNGSDHNKQPPAQSSVAAKTPPGGGKTPLNERESYIIGPEDVLEVSVWKNPELTQEATVRPDGRIALKLVGEVDVVGMPVSAVRRVLAEKYRDFIPEAEVSVSLKEMNSFKVYVLGRVSKPGEYRVRSSLSVLQALAMAGGFTTYANEKKIKIFRTVDGKEERPNFNYRKVLEGKGSDVMLEPGDRLVIP